jgi:hypothetical protein
MGFGFVPGAFSQKRVSGMEVEGGNRFSGRGASEKGLGRASPFEFLSQQVFTSREKGGERHDTDCFTYRCFLPDLTGFINVCHVGSTSSPGGLGIHAGEEFSSRTFNPA